MPAARPTARLMEMPLPMRAAPVDGPGAATFRDPLIIQRAVSTPGAAASAHGAADTHQAESGSESGGGDKDVDALAREVWSQLRRRLSNEAMRAGHR